MSIFIIAIAYALGSVPSSCIVGRLAGGLDLLGRPDGDISASAVYDELGLLPFLWAASMDFGLAFLAVTLSMLIGESLPIVILAGCAAVAGHNWSIFTRFKGGLGATAIGGSLAGLLFWPFLCGLVAARTVFVVTSKSTLSFIVGISVVLVGFPQRRTA